MDGTPSMRYNHSMTSVADSSRIIMLGGVGWDSVTSTFGRLSDAWELARTPLATSGGYRWRRLANCPVTLGQHGATEHESSLYVHTLSYIRDQEIGPANGVLLAFDLRTERWNVLVSVATPVSTPQLWSSQDGVYSYYATRVVTDAQEEETRMLLLKFPTENIEIAKEISIMPRTA